MTITYSDTNTGLTANTSFLKDFQQLRSSKYITKNNKTHKKGIVPRKLSAPHVQPLGEDPRT